MRRLRHVTIAMLLGAIIWPNIGYSASASSLPRSGAAAGPELFGVSARSRTDVWAVGRRIDPATLVSKTLILHWDGRRVDTFRLPGDRRGRESRGRERRVR
jgi:hypothetical protein